MLVRQGKNSSEIMALAIHWMGRWVSGTYVTLMTLESVGLST